MISSTNRSIITEADTPEKYHALRSLWCSVFGDEPDYVDAMFDCFGEEIKGYIVVSDSGGSAGGIGSTDGIVSTDSGSGEVRALSALVCYRCGELTISDLDMEEVCGKTVYVSYAVCTDPDYRGRGLAGQLTSHIRDIVTDAGGLSIVSPAEESLQDFYSELGYRPFFYASEALVYADEALSPVFADAGSDYFDDLPDLSETADPPVIEELWPDDDSEPFEPALDVKELDAAAYNRYREAFLMDEPHIVLSERMMEFVKLDSHNRCGLFAINGGDAICAVRYIGGGRLILSELIVNPMLAEISAEIGSEIAGRLAKHFGARAAEYREPGMRYCQSMLAGRLARSEAGMPRAAYFGFPLD
ncbi:MAG: hypothetical protein IJH95_00300 [Mogibacterium sp.]|nr:hypothetical protein [Mogibacterium sp.]